METAPLDQLQQRLESLIDQVKDEYEGSELEARLMDIRDRLEETIINYPIRSLAVGVVIGLLIGKLFSDNED